MERYPEVEELSFFLEKFNKESDRGAALIAGSILDEWLLNILKNYFAKIKSTDELLNGLNAPLWTFSAKSKVAYSLGLLEQREYEEIEIFRKIRNSFGHDWQDASFESKSIIILCNKLPWTGPLELEEGASVRGRFNFAIATLLMDLMWRARLVEKEQRAIKKWSNKSRK